MRMRERVWSREQGMASLPVRLPLWWGPEGQCSLYTHILLPYANPTKPLQFPARETFRPFSLFVHMQ
jgi:hypothetical protein